MDPLLLHGQESTRIYFKPVDRIHFDQWLEFHKNPASTQYWQGDFEDPTTECEKWYDRQQYRYEHTLGGMNALIDKHTGKLIGHCGLLVQTVDLVTEIEIGYSLVPAFWGKGLATEAAQKCRDFAFENKCTDRLISIISLTNIPSQKVATKNGMSLSKSTTYKMNDVHIYSIHKDQWNQIKKA